MKFTEAKLEQAILQHLEKRAYAHIKGTSLKREPQEVLIKEDLRTYLKKRYRAAAITDSEVQSIISDLKGLPAADLYASNKAIMKRVSDGFLLKREDRSKKDLYIQLIDYSALIDFRPPKADELPTLAAEPSTPYQRKPGDFNIYKVVNQLEIIGHESRIPDAILYINGLPLVVFEFKSAIREKATTHDAYVQLTTRYQRDIPELFKYNAFCVLSDGVNNKAGSFFAAYDHYYAWRRVEAHEQIDREGISSLYSMLDGLFNKERLVDVIRNFIYLPDSSRSEQKVLCRYPQYYASKRLYQHIVKHMRPTGDGKGGTYFGATGCGKSFTMLFLTRLLMRSVQLSSPTIVLITDRTDLDDQLAKLFTASKAYIGDALVLSVNTRDELRSRLGGRASGGVFLTTIQKFTEDTELLSKRSNIICISDEAHRSQVNLDQKVRVSSEGVKRTFGFAKYLHDSLPNATFVGFTGTPIDATLDVFGEVVDSYTMNESVADEITVPIVYEGRAAKVLLDNKKLEEIEDYYAQCADGGASDYAIEESKRANAQMNAILGDPDRLKAVAADFIKHYERRIDEKATVAGKAMFVSSSRKIAWAFYQEVLALRPQWAEVKACAEGELLSEEDKKKVKAIERVKLVMTRNKDDEEALYKTLGTKESRKELDRQFKLAKSNFKIAIVVDMWLTGFDVPFLDTMYIDKAVKQHNLIQTISRVNRQFENKKKGLVVDYIGIKKQMNLALAKYSKAKSTSVEDIYHSIKVVKDHLDLMAAIFHSFDSAPYFTGDPIAQLHCLNMAAEFVQKTDKLEKRFMFLAKRMKAAYNICVGTDALSQNERDRLHFYFAVRSIIYKLTRGNAPDLAQMNARVQGMIAEALKSDGVEELFKLGDDDVREIDIFDPDYLAKLAKIKLPNTKVKLLQKLLAKAIEEFKKVNRLKGVDFSKKFQSLVEKYNDRKEEDVLRGEVLEDFSNEIIDLYQAIQKEHGSFNDLGIGLEEKAFYDILKSLTVKYDFAYPEEKLLILAKKVKDVVDDKAKYTDWSQREDIKAELKVGLIIVLAENDYPPVDRDEVYKEIFEQAENFKRHRAEA